MVADILEPAREDAREKFPDNAEETADSDPPLNIDRGPRTAAVAQAQRESYLKKGEDLIHSLL